MSSPAADQQLFLDPLGYLRTEIYRQRVACNTLEALAHSDANGDIRADAERMLRYITEELPLHMADLDDSLIPLLGQRVLPADDFDAVMAQCPVDRGCRGEPLDRLVLSLRRIADGGAPPATLKPDADTLVNMRRLDLAWENDVILPLAEKRIADTDLASLGRSIADRRGVTCPK